jgi:hypothetical protein
MNLREIEETLHTLEERHPGLNEVMLVTLLRAGGWEEKQVEEARMLFRASPPRSPQKIGVAEKLETLPVTQEAPVFVPMADEKHLLTEHVAVPVVAPVYVHTETQSLVAPTPVVTQNKREELPHNLPLRPFETSEHIWPFERYRDVFYGDSGVDVPPPQQEVHTEVKTNVYVAPQVVVHVEEKPQETLVEQPAPKVEEVIVTTPTHLPVFTPVQVPPKMEEVAAVHTGDEKLVVLACSMLVALLLLLGYMYSNGRL